MKKLLLVLTSVALGSGLFAQNKTMQRMDRTIKNVNNIALLQNKGDFKGLQELLSAATLPNGVLHLEYNATATQFDTIDREIFSDYQDGFAKLNITQTYSNGQFVDESKLQYYATIDTANNVFDLDSAVSHQWDPNTNAWVRAYYMVVESHGFAKFDKITTYLNSSLFSLPLGFVKWAESVYYYDGNDFLTAQADMALNTQTFMSMLPDDSTAYSNDVNGNPTTEIQYQYEKHLMSRRADEKIERTFDANDNTTLATYYWYDTLATSFKESIQISSTYDANDNLTESIHLVWDGTSAFENSHKSNFTYNANNDETLEEVSDWTGTAWEKTWRKTTVYGPQGEIGYDLEEYTADNGNTWGNQDQDQKNIYIYDITLSSGSIATNNSVKVYPNPSNGLVTLSIENGSTATVTLFNIAGEAVYSNVVNATSNVTLDFSSLSAGSYLMQVRGSNSVEVKRLVITE